MYDFLVIGAGLIGAAAARYLAQLSANTAVLGPEEPTDWANHRGVFGSHYDQGRITWQLNGDPVWAALARRAAARYQTIEESSGVRFYTPVGCLNLALPTTDDGYLDAVRKTAVRLNAAYDPVSSETITRRFPFLHFPTDCAGVWEPPPAGTINPRELIQAQLLMAQRQGATMVPETAVTVIESDDGVTVHTLEGNEIHARRVLLATGAFSNAYDLLPRKLALRVKTEAVIMARLSPAEAERLRRMPPVLYRIEHPTITDIYLLPPIRYPDGHVYVKLGANSTWDRTVTTLEEMRAWYIRGESDVVLPTLRTALQQILPGLRAEAYSTHRCLIAYTPHGKPFIDAATDRLFTAVGGNGVSAKSSPILGEIAGKLVANGRWSDPDLAAADFRLRYAA